MPAAHECTHGSAPAPVIASSTQPSACEASGGCTVRCRPKPDAVGTAPASTAVSAGSSTWTTSRCPRRQPAAQVGDVDGEPLGQRLRQLAPGAEVGEHLVAARPLDGRRQRPRSGDLDLERAVVPLRLLLQPVEVLGEQAAGPAVVDAGCVGEPPAGRLQVGAELGHHGERAAGHGRGSAATGHLGQVGQVGQLAEDEPHRLVEVALVVARVRADAAGERHRGSRPAPSSVARRSSGIGSSTTPTAWLACSRPRSVTNPTWLTVSSGRPKK